MTPRETERITSQLRLLLLPPDGGSTDAELLGEFVHHADQAAFATLLQRHGPMVMGVCRRVLRNEADAEDAFQATFLVLVRRAASIRSRGSLGSWLYGVARRTAIRAKSLASRRREKESLVADPPSTDAKAPKDEGLLALLDEELARLPKKYRDAIVLCELQGRKLTDAAREFGCPVGTVSCWLTRGRAMLAERLARRGHAAPVAALTAAGAASVPAPLLASTALAAAAVVAGESASGLVSAHVAALVEAVTREMFLARLKLPTLALLVTLAAVGAGAASATTTHGRGDDDGAPGPAAVDRKADTPPVAPGAVAGEDRADGAAQPAREREAAEWVLRAGGKAVVRPVGQGKALTARRLEDLPRQAFQLTGAVLDRVRSVRPADLARFYPLSAFTDLEMRDASLDKGGLVALGGCRRLNLLCADFNRLTNDDLEQLARLPARKLSLRGNSITDEGLSQLRNAVGLTELNLSENPIEGPGLAHLAGMSGLTSLYLRKTPVRGGGLRHLPRLPALQELWLPEGALGTIEEAAGALAGSPALRLVAVCADAASEGERLRLRGVMAQAKQRATGKMLVLWRVRLAPSELRRLRDQMPSFTLRYFP